MLQELQSVVAEKISTYLFFLLWPSTSEDLLLLALYLDISSYSKASLQYYWEFYLVRQLHFETMRAKKNLQSWIEKMKKMKKMKKKYVAL